MFPLIDVLDPTERIVPVDKGEFGTLTAAAILPPTILLLVRTILCTEYIMELLIFTLPVVCTSLYAPIIPPLTVIEEPINVVPVPSGPDKSVKSLGVSWLNDLSLMKRNPNAGNRVFAISLRFIMKILRFHLAWCLQKIIANEIYIQQTMVANFQMQANQLFDPVVES